MPTSTTHISTKYQVVIPKLIREQVQFSPHDTLIVSVLSPHTVILRKAPKSILELKGTYKFPKNYLKKERLSWD